MVRSCVFSSKPCSTDPWLMFFWPGSKPRAITRERPSPRSSHCTPTAVVAFHEPPAGVKVWIALAFQLASRLSALLRVEAPGLV